MGLSQQHEEANNTFHPFVCVSLFRRNNRMQSRRHRLRTKYKSQPKWWRPKERRRSIRNLRIVVSSPPRGDRSSYGQRHGGKPLAAILAKRLHNLELIEQCKEEGVQRRNLQKMKVRQGSVHPDIQESTPGTSLRIRTDELGQVIPKICNTQA